MTTFTWLKLYRTIEEAQVGITASKAIFVYIRARGWKTGYYNFQQPIRQSLLCLGYHIFLTMVLRARNSAISSSNSFVVEHSLRASIGILSTVYIYKEDITRWREDMNFMFEWQEQYLTSERSERVRYCSYHENIKFISSSQRVMFFLLYGD